MSTDELKKLANWGMYRFDPKAKKNTDLGYSPAPVYKEPEPEPVIEKESLSSKFRARSNKPDSTVGSRSKSKRGPESPRS